ncbi:MAG: acetate--CoA ligase [Actinomycetota bacterium]
MSFKPIEKRPWEWDVPANLESYDDEYPVFTWDRARELLDGLPAGGLNIAYEAVDRHAAGPLASSVAIRWLGKHGDTRELTYADLRSLTNRFANVLRGLGIAPGDRVYGLTGRIPELYVAALGTLKNRSIFSPLFSAFGPEPIHQRMTLGRARVLITTEALYERKVEAIRSRLPDLEHVLLVGEHGATDRPGTLDLGILLEAASDRFEIEATDPKEGALLHFTSGTTGKPKGALHVHEAVVAHNVTGQMVLDFHPDDVFWCTADPGWVTGTSYGIISPLTNGITSIVDEAEFEAERWYRILQDEHVTVWYTAPTALRMLMKSGADLPHQFDLRSLRFIASVGEPLNPEAVVWGMEAFGLPIHDNWWQTETGGIMIANYRSMDVRPGSMGRPLPGIQATVLRRDEEGNVLVQGDAAVEAGVKEEGELALRPGWPSMFREYLGDPERYSACFVGGWYHTGDLVWRDEDGYFWFVGRGDDVIKSAGHLIGPFEVESALMEHPAVAEAGVIGVPDPIAGQIVKAFVTLKTDFTESEELRREIMGFARKRLGPAVAPRSIDFREQLPHTRSGKVMRRLLRARELGLPEGDTSTLENQS